MKTSKSKFATSAIVVAVAAAMTVSTFSTEASAGKRGKWIALGVGAGIVGTAIIANERRRAREHHYHESAWERHVRRCYQAYRSYDEDSDTWIDKYGRERICRK